MRKYPFFKIQLVVCLSFFSLTAISSLEAKANPKTAATPATAASPAAKSLPPTLSFSEYYIGDPITRDHLQIVPNYLLAVKMNKMPPGAAVMGKDTIHLEVDIHAQVGEPHGFSEGAWIPYLTVHFTLTKVGSKFKKTGVFSPMTAVDGPHYANNVKMEGPGTYHLTYIIDPPSSNGFLRHVDKVSGVPGWWKPIKVEWTFAFPGKRKL